MLDGVRANEIVVGAYTDGAGGVCPMLAAHRNGGRTSFLSFARAWDAFACTDRVRRATARELRVLDDLLVASLADEANGATDLGAAIADHRATVARRRPELVARRLRPSVGVRYLRSRREDVSPADPGGPRGAAGAGARTAL